MPVVCWGVAGRDANAERALTTSAIAMIKVSIASRRAGRTLMMPASAARLDDAERPTILRPQAMPAIGRRNVSAGSG
jgi:hypothetical protein